MNRKILNMLCRRVVYLCREFVRALFLVVLIGVSASGWANEQVNDFRLFFPVSPSIEEPSAGPDFKRPSIPSEPTITGKPIKRSASGRSSLKLDTVTKKAAVRHIIFNGFVRGTDNFLVLVNDLPCRIISNDSSNEIIGSKRVVCAHMNQERYSLKIKLDKQALLVFKNKKYVGTLFVGQGI